MNVITKSSHMYARALELKKRGQSIGLVPTMGALHEGHMSLIRQARKENDVVIVSIFVNPLQFGGGEDFSRYPRPFKKDFSLCSRASVDYVFNPAPSDLYPDGFSTYVEVDNLSSVLCGKSRPGHFRGVATVVNKLCNITCPDIMYVGQKDAQQSVIIRRMAVDLNLPVVIRVMPIIREPDGLAMSSRNEYLNGREREDALVLYNSLMLAKNMVKAGTRDVTRIISAMKKFIRVKKNALIDYVAVVEPDTLVPFKKITGQCLIALAVRIGKTRLIDNIVLTVKKKP